MLVPIWEPVAWYFAAVARFVCDMFFGTSRGYTLESMLPSPAEALARCSFGIIKGPTQINKWHQQHLQTKQGFETTLPRNNPNKSFVTLA